MGVKSGLYIYILRQGIRGLPYSIEEAAFVDGAGYDLPGSRRVGRFDHTAGGYPYHEEEQCKENRLSEVGIGGGERH